MYAPLQVVVIPPGSQNVYQGLYKASANLCFTQTSNFSFLEHGGANNAA
jgi:hypothetical protein